MSRWVETDMTTQGRRYYTETLADAEKCRYLINEVYCNAENRDMCCDFPEDGDCVAGKCPFFCPEPDGEIEKLKAGVVSYD